jgi:hypothetical protein
MPVRFVLSEENYVLLEERQGEWAELAVLAGGAAALVRPARPLDEAELEGAIEIAEDWLMPHARRLRGEVLEVTDETGRLGSGLDAVLSEPRREWSIDEFETLFLRLVDMVTGRKPPAAVEARELFVADVLILRELAHHGQVGALRLA